MPKGVYERKPKDEANPMVVTVTWLGEDSLHEDGAGPDSNEWNGIVFPKGEAVEVSDPRIIEKAKANPFYVVEEAA
jgi:hypothetical protein